MSRLTETMRAYKKVASLLDQETRTNRSKAKELASFRDTVDIAFYILSFGQFEYLVKREARDLIEGYARQNTLDGRAWKILEQRGDMPLRKMLEIIYHGKPEFLKSLNESYDIRNDSVHGNKSLPKEAKDVEIFIQKLLDLADDLDR